MTRSSNTRRRHRQGNSKARKCSNQQIRRIIKKKARKEKKIRKTTGKWIWGETSEERTDTSMSDVEGFYWRMWNMKQETDDIIWVTKRRAALGSSELITRGCLPCPIWTNPPQTILDFSNPQWRIRGGGGVAQQVRAPSKFWSTMFFLFSFVSECFQINLSMREHLKPCSFQRLLRESYGPLPNDKDSVLCARNVHCPSFAPPLFYNPGPAPDPGMMAGMIVWDVKLSGDAGTFLSKLWHLWRHLSFATVPDRERKTLLSRTNFGQLVKWRG